MSSYGTAKPAPSLQAQSSFHPGSPGRSLSDRSAATGRGPDRHCFSGARHHGGHQYPGPAQGRQDRLAHHRSLRRNVLEIQRTNRPDMYNLFYRKPIPLVPRNLRLEATERMLADGTVQTALDLASVHIAVESLRQAGVTALAICFLNAYINPGP